MNVHSGKKIYEYFLALEISWNNACRTLQFYFLEVPPPYLKGLLSLQKHPIESLEAYFECGFYDQIFLDCRSDPIPIGCRCFFGAGQNYTENVLKWRITTLHAQH